MLTEGTSSSRLPEREVGGRGARASPRFLPEWQLCASRSPRHLGDGSTVLGGPVRRGGPRAVGRSEAGTDGAGPGQPGPARCPSASRSVARETRNAHSQAILALSCLPRVPGAR